MTPELGPQQAAQLRRAEAQWLRQCVDRLRRHAGDRARRATPGASADASTATFETEETPR